MKFERQLKQQYQRQLQRQTVIWCVTEVMAFSEQPTPNYLTDS
ncbi:hypothetical protein [Shewanella waksmanii]